MLIVIVIVKDIRSNGQKIEKFSTLPGQKIVYKIEKRSKKKCVYIDMIVFCKKLPKIWLLALRFDFWHCVFRLNCVKAVVISAMCI